MKRFCQTCLLSVFVLMALEGCDSRSMGVNNENSLNQNQNQSVPSLEILLTVYGPSGDVVQTMTVDRMGPVTIAPPADEPDPPEIDYVVMAQADGYYTELYTCAHNHSIDVRLDEVPDLPRAMTGVVIRTSYFGQPSYYAEGTIRAVDPDSRITTIATDAQGRYRLTEGDLGTWRLAVQCSGWEEPVPSSFEILNGADTDYQDLFFEIDMSMDAPNLYLYPEETTQVTVELGFPLGGEVTLSDPPYEDGWDVTVAPDGTIEREFPYLFYEVRLPHRVQRESGWILAAEDLERGFMTLLREQGFVGREITDFLDYWLPLMTDSPWYGIYPLPADELVTLSISPAPDRRRRFWLFMEPLDSPLTIAPPPAPPPLSRDGFTVVEWGAFLGR